MDKRIIYTRPDGGLSVIIPSPDCGLTVEQLAAKDVPAGLQFEVVDVADLPQSRTFRDAWERNGKAVGVSLTKAKEIAHGKRRNARAKELSPLDVEATIPAKAAQAEAARQAIRDKYDAAQRQIDAAADVDTLLFVVGGLA